MIGGLWNGLTGLATFEKALNVESNNSTNVNTVGYKEDVINFADLMYQRNGAGQYGKGSNVATVSKAMYQQGNVKITNNPYDVAIEGRGYFIVENLNTKGERETFYTRAGNFKINENGILKTQNDMNILGLTSAKTFNSTDDISEFSGRYSNFVASQNIGNIDNLITVNAKATDYKTTASADDILNSGNNYKTKSSKINDIDALITDYKNRLEDYSLNSTAEPVVSTSQKTDITFTNYKDFLQNENSNIKVRIDNNLISQSFISEVANQNFKTSLYASLSPAEQLVYGDPSGALTQAQSDMYDLEASKIATMKAFSDKISNTVGLTSTIDTTTGLLNITSLIPGKTIKINEAFINDQNFSSQIVTPETSKAKMGSGIAMVESSRDALKVALQKADADLLEITNTVSLDNEKNNTLNNLSSLQSNLSNLNLSKDSIGEVEISDGIIYVKDGENKFVVGKLQTAAFTNEQGLLSQGDNLYEISNETGNIYNAVNLNKLVGTSLEESKANLANSLTALMIYQKAFEANSKSVTTADDMLQTAIQLKK
jgi:flagellar hook protein FlgE